MVHNTTTSETDWLETKLRVTRGYMARLVGQIDRLAVTSAKARDGGPGHAKLTA